MVEQVLEQGCHRGCGLRLAGDWHRNRRDLRQRSNGGRVMHKVLENILIGMGAGCFFWSFIAMILAAANP